MKYSLIFLFFVVLGLLSGGGTLAAQESLAAARILFPVDETVLTALKGNVSPLARAEYDQGEAAPATQLTHLRLVLKRSSAQEAALDQLLAQQLDSESPNYHKWLTPEQLGTLYGPADSDIATIVSWLQSHGLTVEAVSKARTNIAFSGSVSQVEEALHTQIHSFNANDEQFYSNISNPQIPSALSSVVTGVAHLNTVHPKPMFKRGSAGVRDAKTKLLQSVQSEFTPSLRPDLTLLSPSQLFIVPQDVATIYDTPNTLLNVNYTSGPTYDGTGVNIGIGGDSLIKTTTYWNFRQSYLNQTPPANATTSTENCDNGVQICSGTVQITSDGQLQIYNVDGVTLNTNSGDQDEAYLDTELSSGAAPGATIYYYPSTDLNSGIEQALDDNIVDIFSLSYSNCEWQMDNSDNALANSWWQQAASQGISVTVAAGDSGSAGCDNPNSVTVAQDGLGVNGLASTLYDIAVGGTDFTILDNEFSTYVSATNNATYSGSAKGYIPETTWNDSTDRNFTIAENIPWTATYYPSYAGIWGGSGGASSCSTNTTVYGIGNNETLGVCQSGYAKPSWQTGAGVPDDHVRDIPDVALISGDANYASWLACTDDSYKGATTNCDSNGYFSAFGGTSAATPTFAGILALVKQKQGSGTTNRLGQAAAELYQLANSSNASSIFHDTTVGNDSVPCNALLTLDGSCLVNTGLYDFESGYNTTPGYDLATGWGSIDAKELVNNWGSVSAAKYYNLYVPAATISTPGGSTNATLTVSGVGGYTGTVTLSCAITAYSEGVSVTYPPTCLVSGPVALSVGTTTGTVTLTLNSTYVAAANHVPSLERDGGWAGKAGGFALACLVFFCIPARRRSWRSMVAMLVLMIGLGTLAGCSSGSSSSGGGGGGGTSYGTPTGVYAITVSAVGNDAATTKESATFNLTVN